MGAENARSFLKRVEGDEALRKRLGEKTPEQTAAAAAELGFELTADELIAAEAELRKEMSANIVELSPEDMDNAAGGILWDYEDAPDGHEIGCIITYHSRRWCRENKTWCRTGYYCYSNYHDCVKTSRESTLGD